jgi:hypothetical protein
LIISIRFNEDNFILPFKINCLENSARSLFICLAFLMPAMVNSQMITGIWKGKINRQKAELKIVQNGDSITGTSYYYESANHYRRYTIKGFFDQQTNEVVWWDDQLVEERNGRINLSSPGKNALLARADFNCPGSGKMMLDGKAGRSEEDMRGEVHLDKTNSGNFADEWDFVIENYLVGANDPGIIDSIASIHTVAYHPQDDTPVTTPVNEFPVARPVTSETHARAVIDTKPVTTLTAPRTIEEKFAERKKVFTLEIPLSGDSVELRFFDSAEIDGDSISLFLNDRLIFQHIRLLGSAYTIKLAVNELADTNELIMVAENLGSIPPNTSYMVAIVNDKRYEARLESTEGSSAMVRLVKK